MQIKSDEAAKGFRFDPAAPISLRARKMLAASNAIHGSHEFSWQHFLRTLARR